MPRTSRITGAHTLRSVVRACIPALLCATTVALLAACTTAPPTATPTATPAPTPTPLPTATPTPLPTPTPVDRGVDDGVHDYIEATCYALMPFADDVTLGAQTMGELVTEMEPVLLLDQLTPPAELQEFHTAQQELAQYLVSIAEEYAPDTSLALLFDDSIVTEKVDALADADAAAWERLAPAVRELFAGYGCGWAFPPIDAPTPAGPTPVPTPTPLPRVVAAVQEYADLACPESLLDEDTPLDEVAAEIEAAYEAVREAGPPPVLREYHKVVLAGLELSLIAVLFAQEQEAGGEEETREDRAAMANLYLQAKNLELAGGPIWRDLDPAVQQALTESGCLEP